MAPDESDRLHLFETVRHQWGERAATALINLLPPDGDRVATKTDLGLGLAGLEAKVDRLEAGLTAVESRLAAVESRLDARIDGLDAKIDLVADRSDAKIEAEVERCRGDLLAKLNDQTRTLMLSMVGMWLTLMVAILIRGG